jgi:protein phosphatase
MLDLEFFQLSDPGLQRDHNEDSCGYFDPPTTEEIRSRGWLFALADGVGVHDRGEVASRMAVQAMVSGFARLSPEESLTGALPKLVQAANTQVYEAARSTFSGPSNMATTLVACALRYDRAVVAHAGDSRCYLLRKGAAMQLTRDHTLANEQLRLGLLTSAEASVSTNSHILSRALGGDMFLNVDSSEHQVLAGDLLLLCSDGLHHSIEPVDMVRIAATYTPLSSVARALIELANQRDGSDNISVQLIRILAVEQVGMYRGRHYKLY